MLYLDTSPVRDIHRQLATDASGIARQVARLQAHVIGLELRIGGKQYQPFEERLADEKPIEGVAVMVVSSITSRPKIVRSAGSATTTVDPMRRPRRTEFRGACD